jgi:outer membrane receptor protein involved in Fe transport
MNEQSVLARSIRTILFAGMSSAFIAVPAMAQEETQQNEEQEAQEQVQERIQVTGSRIRTDGLDSATPLEVISSEVIEEQGLSTLGELLRTSTVASGSDQLIAAYSVGFVTAGGAGAESVSMRGLGANRTLILLNGRRAGPAGTRGEVAAFDLNALPVSAIERVEILKDGASSLYGSDAVAGVINIITKKGDGGSVDVSGNLPVEGGGETYRVNANYGESFSKGSWRVVADYNVDTGMVRGDRDNFACETRYFFDPESGERVDPIDPRTGEYACNEASPGLYYADFNTGQSARIQYPVSGYDFPHVTETNPNITSAPDDWFFAGFDKESDGYRGNTLPMHLNSTVIPETEVVSLYGQGDYDITDTASLYGELLFSQRTTESENVRQFWTRELSYQPVNNQAAQGWGATDDNIRFMPVHITDHFGNETTIDYGRAVLGLEGSLGFWNYDISYQRSHNSGEYASDIIFADSMIMAQETYLGVPCEGRVTASGRECVNYDWLDPENMYGNPSQAARDFLFGRDVGNTTYKQETLDAYITGDLFDMPAGPVGTAMGVYWQSDEIKDVPGDETLAGNSWGLTGAGITEGKAFTKAAYAEFKVPVLEGLPLVDRLDVTASGRWTDVSTYGSDTTFKISTNWHITDEFRLRASRGTSFRAPALFEVYLDNQTGFLGQTTDPCLNWVESSNPNVRANCQAAGVPESYTNAISGSYTSITGGGEGQLEAETSVSEGVGLVYSSDDGRFAASIDYYDVVIRNQISDVGGSSVLSQCYTSDDFANEPFCDQITRKNGSDDGDWGIVEVRGGYLNTAKQTVRGVDIVLSYRDQFDFGDISVKLEHTNQIERAFQQFEGEEADQYIGRVGNPKHVANLNVQYGFDDWNFSWNTNFYDKTNEYDYFGTETTTYRGEEVSFIAETPTYVLHSVSASTSFNDNIEVTFGIGNLFDKEPPLGSPAGVYTIGNVPLFASQIDYIGRRAFFNASYKF